MHGELNQELVNFMEQEIFPIYETFDKGHDLNHIRAVIDRALDLAQNIDGIDMNIVYAAAALHDIGIQVQRKHHAIFSGVFVEHNQALRKFFSEEEVMVIKAAVEDHSTSKGVDPRSIYGKIVCDADKDDDLETSLLRAYEFTQKYYPDYNEEECIRNVYEQLQLKFGVSGKVKFWINTEKQQSFLKRMQELAHNEEEFKAAMKAIIKTKSLSLENNRMGQDV